jgi:Flp pilus assembly protein TadG
VVAVSRVAEPRDAGQSLVEFAILIPVLMVVVVGIFEFGRAWNTQQVLTNAAREGARLAVIQTASSGDVQAVITDRLADAGLNPGLGSISVTGMADGYGNPTSVTIFYPYEFVFLGPIMAFLGEGNGDAPGSITLNTEIVMRNE